MNRIFLYFFFTATLFIAGNVQAQTLNVPQNPRLEKETDYAAYTKDVIACVNWLEQTPVDKDPDTRRKATRFLMQWIQGSPAVTIAIQDYVAKFSEVSPEFLMMFMSGWTRYVLVQKDQDELAGNLAGVQSVLNLYAISKSIPRNEEMDKLVQLSKEGKLKGWLQQQLKAK
jgi:hypothetical protein